MRQFPTKESYRDAWAKAYTVDPVVPLNIDIELASICNLACPFCYWGESEGFAQEMKQPDWDGGKKKRFMPTEMALKLIDECASIGVPALKMNYRGESTLHPDYSLIMRLAAEKGILLDDIGTVDPAFYEILVNTNANCKDAAIDGLMAATKCMISLDSLDPKIYPTMRVNGNLDRAIEVVKELKRRGHPNLWVRRVITRANQHEPFVQRAKEIFGADTKVSEHFAFDRNKDDHQMLSEHDMYSWDRTYCGYPSQRLIVTASGKVLACCVAWRDETEVGIWPKQSLLEIWNGEPIKRLRADLRANNISGAPDLCRNCTSYMAYKRPERDFVQDKEGQAVL